MVRHGGDPVADRPRRSTTSTTATAPACELLCAALIGRGASCGSASRSRGGSSPGSVSLGVEYDLRNRLYAHLQALELGFFDRQQTGQLMSRATVDLQSVRFFLGYGLVFIAQSALTILLAAVAMFAAAAGARGAVAGRRCRSSSSSRSATGAARGRRSRRSSSGSAS